MSEPDDELGDVSGSRAAEIALGSDGSVGSAESSGGSPGGMAHDSGGELSRSPLERLKAALRSESPNPPLSEVEGVGDLRAEADKRLARGVGKVLEVSSSEAWVDLALGVLGKVLSQSSVSAPESEPTEPEGDSSSTSSERSESKRETMEFGS